MRRSHLGDVPAVEHSISCTVYVCLGSQMGWLQIAAGMAACVALLYAPGLIVALGLRLRGLTLLAAAPAFGLTTIFIGAYVADYLDIPWSPLAPMGTAVAIAAILWVATRFIPALRPRLAAPGFAWWVPTLVVAIAAALLGAQIVYAIGSPDYFAQEHDNVFHLNAVRHIIDTGVATPQNTAMTLGRTSPTGYPSGWHALNALLVQATGLSVAGASNACLLAVACVVWPLSILGLTRTIVGPRISAAIAAGVLCTTCATFPMLPITAYGGYPLVLAVAVTPVALMAVVELARIGAMPASVLSSALVLALVVPGLVGAHPSALVWIACMTVPVLGIRLAMSARQLRTTSRRAIVLLAFVAYVAVIFLVLLMIPTSPVYEPTGTLAWAIGEALTGSIGGQWAALLVAALCVVGLIGSVRRPTPARVAAVSMWAVAITLYVVAAGAPDLWRSMLTSAWYANPARLAAFIPVVSVPLAALGATMLWDALARAQSSPRSARSTKRRAAIVIPTFAAVLIATQASAAQATMVANRTSFVPTDDHSLARLAVDSDARELLEVLPEIVPEEDLIANNSWDGSGFAYAITGRRVLLPHQIMTLRPQVQDFLDEFATASKTSPACQTARDLGIRWVLRFEPDAKLGRGARDFAGLDGLEDSPNVELVKRVGTASLYRVVGCGLE